MKNHFNEAMPLWQLYVCTALFLILISFVWYRYIYIAQKKKNIVLQEQIVLYTKQRELIVHAQKELYRLQKVIPALNNSINEYLPSNKDLYPFTTMYTLGSLAKTYGLIILDSHISNTIKKDWATISIIHNELQGSLEQLRAYFQAIQHDKHLIAFDSIDLQKQDTHYVCHCNFKVFALEK